MPKTLEDLLDAADALAKEDCPERPDFPIPDDLQVNTAELLERKTTTCRGVGWFARRPIAAGTLLMAAKPLAMVLDHQDEEDEDEMEDDEENNNENEQAKINWMVVVLLLQELIKTPKLWATTLNELYPRNQTEMAKLPILKCHDDALKGQIQNLLDQLQSKQLPVSEIAQRLPLVVRYNVLSIETCPELLSHPNTHAILSGVGLYHQASFFNHAPRPNVARWAIGDVMWFVANQDIAPGTEACISYIEHDVLCESSFRRNLLLRMDFQEDSVDATPKPEEEDGPDMPVVDSMVQTELMEVNPLERIGNIDELMLQAEGKAPPEEDGDEDTEPSQSEWFQCDMQNLRILKAITLQQLGQSKQALALWEECVEFSEQQLPPLDESSVVMRVQAALCAWHVGNKEQAQQHAQQALVTHHKIFGGGSPRLRRRYQRDFSLATAPKMASLDTVLESWWPLK